MNATQLLIDSGDVVVDRPGDSVPAVVVTASAEDLTAVAGVALWGPLLDRLNLVRVLELVGEVGVSSAAYLLRPWPQR